MISCFADVFTITEDDVPTDFMCGVLQSCITKLQRAGQLHSTSERLEEAWDWKGLRLTFICKEKLEERRRSHGERLQQKLVQPPMSELGKC